MSPSEDSTENSTEERTAMEPEGTPGDDSPGTDTPEPEDAELLRDSNPNASGPERAAGGMGVSSERTGPTGPQVGTDGVKDTSLGEPEGDLPPEQAPGAVERNPEGLDPKAGYSSVDPRSD